MAKTLETSLPLHNKNIFSLSPLLPPPTEATREKEGPHGRPHLGAAAPGGRSCARRPRAGEPAPRQGAGKEKGRGDLEGRGRPFLGLGSKLRR